MDCEQLAQLYEEYAIGVLEGEERAELEAHLAQGCSQCKPGVERARWVVAQLAQLAPQADPSAALKSRLMAAIRDGSEGSVPSVAALGSKPASPRSAFPMWAWAAAAALALITGYSIRQMGIQSTQMAELRKQMKVATLQNQILQVQLELGRQVATVMASPDSKAIALMPSNKAMPVVRAYMHPHMGVAVTADEMPGMPIARTLQLWFVPKKGSPKSVAIFRPNADGQVSIIAPVTMPINEIAALAVSEEPAGGSPQPTTTPAWVGKLN